MILVLAVFFQQITPNSLHDRGHPLSVQRRMGQLWRAVSVSVPKSLQGCLVPLSSLERWVPSVVPTEGHAAIGNTVSFNM